DSLPSIFTEYAERKIFLPAPSNNKGEAEIANLLLRKVEAILLEKGFDVVVCDSSHLEKIPARVYGITTIDPFGIGPATSTMVGLSGGKEPFNRYFFERLIKKIRKINPQAVIIVGGPGTWQFDVMPEKQKELGIDCIVQGEVETIAEELFKAALEKNLPQKIKAPPAEKISGIKKPTLWGMVQIGRGCDRGCRFCDPGMKNYKWRDMEEIIKDARINANSPYVTSITLLCEDELRYGNLPGEWIPCGKIVELVARIKKLGKPVTPSHANLSSAAASPEVVREYAKVLELKSHNFSAFQVGLETGSRRLMKIHMKGKALPWKAEEWPDVAKKGFEVLVKNHIFPLATLVAGLPEENEEDVWETICLVRELRDFPSLIMPLFFVPLGQLKDSESFIEKNFTEIYRELYATCFEHTAFWGRKFTSWGGKSLPLLAQWIIHVGTMLAFDYFKALKEKKKLSHVRWVYYLLKENSLFLASRIIPSQKMKVG
ncbi:B12-binding domain-containing radical SAM protein, partial [Candidatus Aerophobetes bacterium]|nr:B12-binding domain-containing radical SAM protein [Candidatus Aerophobetes bacterium]